jgi:gliding motility-associated-like protein
MKANLASRLKYIQLLIAAILTLGSVHAQLHADFTATGATGCSPLVVGFHDISTGNPTQWTWDLGNGTTSTLQNPSASYFNPGTYNIKLVIKNANGADSIIKSQLVTVHDNPVANFAGISITGCYPLRAQFTDLSIAAIGNIAQWQWDFGDGFVSNQQNPNHIYTSQGQFDVKLKVTTNSGCFKVVDKQAFINISGGVKADFSYSTAGTCQPPTAVTFTNKSTGTGLLSYQWFFGDGNFSTDINPVHSYSSPGSYTIVLVTTNILGCTDTIKKVNGLVVGTVHPDFAMVASACAGTAVQMSNTSTPATVSTAWYFSDGTNDFHNSTTKTFNTPGVYQVKLVNNFGSCTDSITKSINIIEKPTAAFTAVNNIACAAPVSVQFSNNSMGGATYFWNFGDGNNSTLQNPAHLFNLQGDYNVSLIVTSANGCIDSVSKQNFATIHPPKVISISADPKEGCKPLPVDFASSVTSVQNIVKYEWDFGDGNTSTQQLPTHTYTTEGVFTVKLTITTTAGCTDTYTSVNAVKVGHKPVAAFSATPLNGCASSGVSFTDQSTNGPLTTWLWDFGDGSTATDQNPFHQYTDVGDFNIRLISSNNGCKDTLIKLQYIHIKPPIAKFNYTANNCENKLEVIFTDKSTGAITYNWDFGDGSSSNAPNPVHIFPATGSYQVTLTVTNDSCSHTKQHLVTVDNRKGKLKIPSMIACRMGAVTFSVDSLDFANVVSYDWNIGTGTMINTTGPSTAFRYPQVGTYPVSVIITYANNCKDTLYASSSITIYGPTAGFSAVNNFFCSGSTVDFIDATTNDGMHAITSWDWNYGDGSSTVNYPAGPFSHQYNIGGTITVALKVTDSYGCTDSITKPTIITIGKTVAAFAESDTMLCPGYHVDFNNLTTGGNLSYQWSFGDGATSNSINPTHDYPTEGTYTIKLIAVDSKGCNDTLVKVNRIKVYRPVAAFTMSDSFAVCPPLLVNMANNSTNVAIHKWTFGDGSTAYNQMPSHLYTYPGNYAVKLVVTNNGGCSDSATRTVKVLGPTGVFTYTPTLFCVPMQVNFSSVTQNAVSLIWDYNNGAITTTTGNTSSYTYTDQGAYIPKLILEDITGCRVPIIGKDTVHAKDIKAQIGLVNTTVCDSGYVNFQHASITNDIVANYVWHFGDGTTSTQAKPSHKYSVNGFYSVKLFVKTQTGCSDSITVNKLIKVVTKPRMAVTGDTSVCRNGSLQFMASIINPDTSSITWNWNFGNGNTYTIPNPPAQVFPQAGNITVTTILNSSNGCADTSKKTVAVRELPNVDAGMDTTICRNQSYTLHATGAASYLWEMTQNTLSCINCPSPVAKPLTSIMYRVTGKNGYNCIATDSVWVKVQQHLNMTVDKGDTLCLGETAKMKASGTEKYNWFPALYVDNPSAGQVNIRPAKDTLMNYRVIGTDSKNCFADTAFVKVKTYPVPKMEIKQDDIIINAGSTVKLETTNTADVSKWKWTPAKGLDKDNIASPTATARESIVYTCVAANDGQCITRDEVRITVICNGANIFVPNTFSPNNDGNNDVFYPRGKGLFTIKSLRVFNRWGEVVFEKMGFQANDAFAGWDGTFKGSKLPSDVYVYSMEVQCDNSTIIPTKGNVTLLR